MISLGKNNAPKKEEQKNWYNDRHQFVVVQRNILILITLVSLVSALALTLIVNAKVNQISVEPFVIQIDKRSGITQVVDPISPEQYSANESVRRYFIATYIRAREEYGRLDRNRTFQTVRTMSGDERIFSNYYWSTVDPNNKDSVATRLGKKGVRRAKIKSIIFLGSQSAQVEVLIEEFDGRSKEEELKIIYIEFEFAELKLTLEERYLNPLGFRVTKYSVNDVSGQ